MTMTKQALIAGVFLTAASMAGVATAGAPVVYGKANVSLNFDDTGAANSDTTTWNSNASRLGVKGKHKLENGMQAFYKAEFEISVDDGDKSGQTFTQRNIYAGLKGNFGAVKAGKFDTPTKLAIKKVDLFNDMALGDVKEVLEGENRESNMVQYSSNKFSGVQFNVALIAGEEKGSGSRDGVADGISTSAVYKADNLYLALAHDSEVDGNDTAITRLVAQYSIDAFKLGAAIQQTEYNKTDDSLGYVLSAAYKVGKNTFKAQYTAEGETSKGANDDDAMISLGVDHKLSKKVKVYGYYTDLEEDKSVKNEAQDESTFGLGFEVKF